MKRDTPDISVAQICRQNAHIPTNGRNKIFLPITTTRKDAPKRASFLILSLNFISFPTLIRILLFPFPQFLLSLLTCIESLDFRCQESGEGINNGLRQFDLVWILTFFLAGHSVLPQQQNLSGSTQSILHSFPAIHSCQRLFPCTEGEQIILKPEKFLIELLSHPFPSGDFTGKSRVKQLGSEGNESN